MTQTLSFPIVVVLAASAVAAVTDLRSYRIHNALTLPLLFTGLAYHGARGGLPGLATSGLAAFFGFFILFQFYLMGGMGGGDVKLMAGVGAWLGLPLVFYAFVGASVAAGLYALVLIAATGRLREVWANFRLMGLRLSAATRQLGADDHVESEVLRADRRRRLVPFGAMVGVGVVAALLWLWLGV